MTYNGYDAVVVEPTATSTTGPRIDRLVIGLLLAAAGVGWLLDQSGIPVPWRMFPAAALVVVGLALLASLLGGSGRRTLIALGITALIVGVSVGVGVNQYGGPVGDRVVTPSMSQWPVNTQLSAGTLTVDLTRNPLPESGSLVAGVGAGRIVVLLPADSRPSIDARITAGTVSVDGVKVSDGIDVRWSTPNPLTTAVRLDLQVGLGDIEVSHD